MATITSVCYIDVANGGGGHATLAYGVITILAELYRDGREVSGSENHRSESCR